MWRQLYRSRAYPCILLKRAVAGPRGGLAATCHRNLRHETPQTSIIGLRSRLRVAAAPRQLAARSAMGPKVIRAKGRIYMFIKLPLTPICSVETSARSHFIHSCRLYPLRLISSHSLLFPAPGLRLFQHISPIHCPLSATEDKF